MVSFTHRSLYPPQPDRPAHNQSLYWLSYPGSSIQLRMDYYEQVANPLEENGHWQVPKACNSLQTKGTYGDNSKVDFVTTGLSLIRGGREEV